MPLYLMLTTLTEKGRQTLNANPARLREVNRDVEAPDELTMANLSVKLGARGSVKFQTMALLQVDDLLAALEA